MRRTVLLVILVILALIDPRPAAARYASIIVDAESGRVLHAINADTPNFPASLTKLMTLYMIFEALEFGQLELDEKLPVSRVAERRSPSKLGLRRGQRITVRDVIGTLVTKSANDAATVAAEALGGTERNFARMMTGKAHELGMTRSTFRNASGLPHWRQRSTARDMATLSRALWTDYPQYYHYFSLSAYEYAGRKFHNHNKLLDRYDGLDGLKTGYIRASGYNVAVSVERRGTRLIGVLFGGRSPRWRDRHMARLLDRSFSPAPGFRAAQRSRLAKTPPLPRKKPVRSAGAGSQDWSVQVGKFTRYSTAHRAVTRAAHAVPGLLHSQVSIYLDSGVNGRDFVARIAGLSKINARRACSRLRRKNIDCDVVPTNGQISQGSR